MFIMAELETVLYKSTILKTPKIHENGRSQWHYCNGLSRDGRQVIGTRVEYPC